MPDSIEPAGVKSAALASIEGGAQPDPGATPLAQVIPPSRRGGKRAGAGRKPSRRPLRLAPGEETAPGAGPDEIDTAEAARVNNAVALNRTIDQLLAVALGEEMRAAEKEMAQLDAALIEYQKIKGDIPVPVELVLFAAYSTVYGKKLTAPTPKLRLYAAWMKLRGAVAAVVAKLRRRK